MFSKHNSSDFPKQLSITVSSSQVPVQSQYKTLKTKCAICFDSRDLLNGSLDLIQSLFKVSNSIPEQLQSRCFGVLILILNNFNFVLVFQKLTFIRNPSSSFVSTRKVNILIFKTVSDTGRSEHM